MRQRLDAFLKEWTDRGLQSPDHIRFLTYTTRYNKSFWVTVDGLGQHYERAEVDARRLSGGTSYQIKTTNVSRLVLRETEQSGRGCRSTARRCASSLPASWRSRRPALAGNLRRRKWAGLHKTHGLQGPIDDAFLDPFLLVRPTGTPWNQAAHQLALKRLERFDQTYARFYRAHPRVKNDTDVTEADFAKYNVVLFGDPGSNRWIGRLAGRLPVKWSRDTVAVGDKSFPAASHLPVMVYPNPIAPSKLRGPEQRAHDRGKLVHLRLQHADAWRYRRAAGAARTRTRSRCRLPGSSTSRGGYGRTQHKLRPTRIVTFMDH